jgi:hypothetical protein
MRYWASKKGTGVWFELADKAAYMELYADPRYEVWYGHGWPNLHGK